MTDVLAIGAHPDDSEFFCGGILARLVGEGKTVVMCDLTLGERASNGTAELRRSEALAASQILGVERLFLDFHDLEIFDTFEGRVALVEVIRKTKPKLVLAPPLSSLQNHPDHCAAAKLSRAACRYAKMKNLLPQLPPHTVSGILHYAHPLVDDKCDFIVDVSDHIDTWKKMIDCHESQMKTLPYRDYILAGAQRLGMMIDRPYGLGLNSFNPIVVEDLMQIAQGGREL